MLPSVNTHLPTPDLPAVTQTHDLYLADAADFSQGWEGWGFWNIGTIMPIGKAKDTPSLFLSKEQFNHLINFVI